MLIKNRKQSGIITLLMAGILAIYGSPMVAMKTKNKSHEYCEDKYHENELDTLAYLYAMLFKEVNGKEHSINPLIDLRPTKTEDGLTVFDEIIFDKDEEKTFSKKRKRTEKSSQQTNQEHKKTKTFTMVKSDEEVFNALKLNREGLLIECFEECGNVSKFGKAPKCNIEEHLLRHFSKGSKKKWCNKKGYHFKLNDLGEQELAKY